MRKGLARTLQFVNDFDRIVASLINSEFLLLKAGIKANVLKRT